MSIKSRTRDVINPEANEDVRKLRAFSVKQQPDYHRLVVIWSKTLKATGL